jgi:hypothetical protein
MGVETISDLTPISTTEHLCGPDQSASGLPCPWGKHKKGSDPTEPGDKSMGLRLDISPLSFPSPCV